MSAVSEEQPTAHVNSVIDGRGSKKACLLIKIVILYPTCCMPRLHMPTEGDLKRCSQEMFGLHFEPDGHGCFKDR